VAADDRGCPRIRDEAAVAWNQVRQLGDTIDAFKAELKTTQAALRRAEKELEREQVRSNWISEIKDRLRAERQRRRPT
jgi:hypothetical protein